MVLPSQKETDPVDFRQVVETVESATANLKTETDGDGGSKQ